MTEPYKSTLSKFGTDADLQAFLSQPEPAGLIAQHDQLTGTIPDLLDQLHMTLSTLKACESAINRLQPHEARAVTGACQNHQINASTAHGRLNDLASAAGLKFNNWESEWMTGEVKR